MTKHSTPFVERFWSNVDRNGPVGFHYETRASLGPCWIWLGATGLNGYGQFYTGRVNGRDNKISAHRFAYEQTKGPILLPQIDHLCRVRACVNPGHLEPVTQIENLQRGAIARPNPTHCYAGHELTPDNVYVRGIRGNRLGCKTCAKRRAAECEKRVTANRTTCGRGHPLVESASMRGGRAGNRYCPICRSARTKLGVRGTVKAPS